MNGKELIYQGIPISIVIMALVQLAKGLGLPTKFAPLLAVGLGILAGIPAYVLNKDISMLFLGLITGLIASGLFSNLKEGKRIVAGK